MAIQKGAKQKLFPQQGPLREAVLHRYRQAVLYPGSGVIGLEALQADMPGRDPFNSEHLEANCAKTAQQL